MVCLLFFVSVLLHSSAFLFLYFSASLLFCFTCFPAFLLLCFSDCLLRFSLLSFRLLLFTALIACFWLVDCFPLPLLSFAFLLLCFSASPLPCFTDLTLCSRTLLLLLFLKEQKHLLQHAKGNPLRNRLRSPLRSLVGNGRGCARPNSPPPRLS